MDSLLSTALEAAEAAAHVHSVHFGKVGLDGAEEKGHSDFVSQVDLQAQRAALSVIRRDYPDHEVLAEEDTGERQGGWGDRKWPDEGEFLWIVDPLDGTTNFLHGHPQFAASVGVGRRVLDEGERRGSSPVGEAGIELEPGLGRGTGIVLEAGVALEAGAVVAARTGERWWARRGQGAFKNGRPIRVSPLQSLRTALIGTGFPFKEPELIPRYLEGFQRVLPASGGIRRAGSAALDLCYLAEGVLDGFWEEEYLSPWDVAAGLIILQEAGGTAARLNGSEIGLENGSILAANSAALLGELRILVGGS